MTIKTIKKKNGETVYRQQLYLGLDQVTGKEVRTTITAKTKRELQVKAKRKIGDFARNGYTVGYKPTVSTYAELVDIWLDTFSHSVKYHTVLTVKSQLKTHLLPAFGNIRLDKLNTAYIQSKVNTWAKAYNTTDHGYKAYNELHRLNKQILTFGVSIQAIKNNPARDVILPKRRDKGKEKKRLTFLDSEQIKVLLAYLDSLENTYSNHFDTVFYKLLLATGCRVGELQALEWSDVDLVDGTISINKTLLTNGEVNSPKSKSANRVISIDRNTLLMLRLYQVRQNQHFREIGADYPAVFSTGIKPYLAYKTAQWRLNAHLKRSGLPHFSFHAFRHTHASLLLNAGISYKELQYRLGHATIAMTLDRYSHLSKDKEKEAPAYFEKALASL